MQHQTDVAVIGGGILGTSTAAHLARAGARVTLVTAGALADGASGRSISWLNSSGDRSPDYHYLRLLGIDRYRTWRARRPDSSRYLNFDGALKWARDGDDLRETWALERASGYDSVWIDRSEAATLAPDVDAAAIPADGAILNPGEGWVHLPDIVTALAGEAVTAGARIIEHAGAAHVVERDGAAAGIAWGDGDHVDADHVVLATGGDVPAHLAGLGIAVPDATTTAGVVITEPLAVPVRTVLNTPRVAVRPTPDGGVILDAGWAERSIVTQADGSAHMPEETVSGLLEEASRILAGNPPLAVRRVAVGPKPIPGDGEPVVGAVPGVDRLSVLFTHSGATLGLILGELLAEEILRGRPSPVLAPFRLDRFDGGGELSDPGSGSWTPARR